MTKLVIASVIILVTLPGCGLFKKKPKLAEYNRNIRLAGRVYQVDEAERYVLIRRYGPWQVEEGDVVESRAEGRSANLMPTGERLGEHVAADIRSGKVEVGDGVYIRKVTAAPKPRSQGSAEAGSAEKPAGSTQNKTDSDKPANP